MTGAPLYHSWPLIQKMSLALIIKKDHANPGVNQTENGGATAASAKHKCHSFTIIMYFLKATMGGLNAEIHISRLTPINAQKIGVMEENGQRIDSYHWMCIVKV